MKRNNEQGRSMIEMLGVLAIAGILSVGGFNLVTKMQQSNATNQIAEEISELAMKTRVVIRDFEETDSVMNTYLKEARAIPESIVYDETAKELRGKYETKYNVKYVGDGGSAVAFQIEISNITEDECMQFVTSNWGSAGTSGFVKMSVKSNDKSAEAKGSMSIGEATDICSDDAQITFSYK